MNRSAQQQVAHQRHTAQQLLLAALAVCIGSALAYRLYLFRIWGVDGDCGWGLYAGQRMLAGVRPYGAELLESNPPWFLWTSEMWAWLAALLHRPAGQVYLGGCFLLCLLSIVWTLRLARRLTPDRSPLRFWGLLAVLIAVDMLMPAEHFGQRDHLLLLLSTPYFFVIALRVKGLAVSRPEAIAAGAAAAFGVCFKPQHVLAIAAASILLLAVRRSLRTLVLPELLICVAIVALYVATARMVFPEYFARVVPMLLDTYWAFGRGTAWSVLLTRRNLILLLLPFTAMLWRRVHSRAIVGVLLASGCGSFAAYLIQAKGWHYQLWPALGFFFLAAAFLAMDVLPMEAELPMPTGRWAVLAALLCLLAYPVFRRLLGDPVSAAERGFPFLQVLAAQPPGTPVWVMSVSIEPTWPVVEERHLFWASRFPHLWMLPAILKTSAGLPGLPKHLSAEQVQRLSSEQRRFATEDLQRWQPVLVLVEQCQNPNVYCQDLSPHTYNLLTWFQQDAQFAALWKTYRACGMAGEHYSVWARTECPLPADRKLETR